MGMHLDMTDKASRDAVKAELKKDFDKSVSKLDFSDYSPSSAEFMHPLCIGLMWHLIHEMEEGETKAMAGMAMTR